MHDTLVTMVSEDPTGGKSAYEDAIRNCCERGGYRFEPCKGVHENNTEPIVRIHQPTGEIAFEAIGYRKASVMLLKRRPSPLSATAVHFRPKRQYVSPVLQQAGVLVGVG